MASGKEHEITDEIIEANCKPSARKLQRYVIPDVATKWYELGLELLDEKEEHKLNIIKSNHGNDAKKCCLEMFLLWLNTNSDANWYQIVEALKSPGVELDSIAVDLEKKFSVITSIVNPDQPLIESDDSENLNFAEFQDVSLAFSTLFSRLQKEIKIKDFKIIKNACVVRAGRKLSEQIKKTRNIDSLFQLFAESKAYCNWMNIRFLEVIANASGSSKLVNLVKNYKEVIYSKTLREVWDCIPYHTVRTKYYSKLQVKFEGKDPDNVTIEQLIRYCEPYVVKDIAMLIGVIEEESLKVTWLIPTAEVHNFYLAALMLPEESRIDSHLQIGDWIVYHPLKVLQSLHKEYSTISPSALLIGYYQSLLLEHVDADSLISKMCSNDLITSSEREVILTGHSTHQRNQLLLELVRHKPTEAMMGFCECVQEISPKVGSQLVTALQSYVADEHHELLSYTQTVMTSSLGVEYNHPSLLHVLFLEVIDQIDEILQQSCDLSLLTRACESLLASETHGISFFTTSTIEILSEYSEAPLLLRYFRFLFNWSNHSILKVLFSFNREAVKLLDKFDSLLYPLNPLVSYPIPSFSQVMTPSETSEYTILSIRGNRELWASSLQYVFNVESFIVEVCEITQHCLQLLAVKSDPTMFYWTIPKCVVGLIKSNVLRHSNRLFSKGILEVAIGDDVIMELSAATTGNARRRLKGTVGSSLTPYSYNTPTRQLSIPNEEKTSHSNEDFFVPSFKHALSWQTGRYTSEQTDYYELSDYYNSEWSKQVEQIISKYAKMGISRSGIFCPRSSLSIEQPKEKHEVQNQTSEVSHPQHFSKFPLDQSLLTLGHDGHYLEDRDYNIIRYAGAGGSAKCNFGNDRGKNTWFVVKRLDSLYKEDVMKESQILQELNHDHVIRFYGALEDLKDYCFKIFLEYADGTWGDIHDLFCKSVDKGIYSGSIARIMLYVQQILLALDYLHRKKDILHLDIKGKNIIVCNDGYKVKLIDFGTACKTDSISKVKSGWTPVFAAPEINREDPPSFSADIWSAMCVAVEMVTGSIPWPNVTSYEQAIFTIGFYENDRITELVQYSEYWDKYNDYPNHFDMYQELVNMWKMVFVEDRSRRPSASYLLNLKWMKEMELYDESILYELISGEKPQQSRSMNNENNAMIDQLSIYSSQEYVANPSYDSSQPTHSYPNQSYPPPNILEPDEANFAKKSYIDKCASYINQGISIVKKSSSMPQLAISRSRDDGKADNLFNCRKKSQSLNLQPAKVAGRHAHKLLVCGGAGSGKRTLKNNWSMTSWSDVVEKIADVEIITCQEFSTDLVQSSSNVSFVVIYLPEDQESFTSAQQALRAIYDAYETPSVTLVENRLGDYLYPTQEPDQPPVLVRLTITSSTPPVFWRVSVMECRQLTGVFKSCLMKPLLARLGFWRKHKLMCWACSEGKLDVLKLLLPYMDNIDPANYLWCIATKLSVEDNQKDQSLLPQLRQLVEYISDFGDHRRVLKKVGNLVEQFPNECLILLNMMGEGIDNQLMCSKLGMSCFPISWIAQDDYTNINLSNNQLKSLPAKLFHLTKLKKLDVSHNQLQSVPSPLNWDCPKLEILSLAANDLRNEQWKVLVTSNIFTPYSSTSTVPPNRISNVCAPSLMKVDISRNVKLSLFPEWLCLLPSLTILDIRGNPLLHTIPPQLSLARHLCVIKLDAEYITSPSPSEVAMGTSAIMTYLRCRHRGSVAFRQIRVVMLGEPATGKHSLYTNLVGTNSSPSQKAHMSIGRYDYPQKRFFGNDRPRITFQVVCFTGAESSMHFLPQCFFTHRSIFLVLWKVTNGEEGFSRLRQQLCNIQARVPGSPVILVGTHADQNSTVTASAVSLWEAKWFNSTTSVKMVLPPITDSILMNCKNKRDVEQLQQVLYKHALELKNPRTKKLFIDEMVPRSYVELQSLIQSEVKMIYTLKEGIPVKYRDHFINFVKEHTFPNTTDDDRELDSACRFLHDVGVIVHYNVFELNNIYFLDPQWLYNILCTIIDPVNTSHGVLRVTEITSLLKELGVARLQHHLFKITELFNIAVCLDMDREKFLIPSLLNSQRPETYPSYNLLSSDVNCKHFYFGYLPNGFCAKLVAQVLLHIKQVLAQLMACRKEDFPTKPVVLVGDNEITEVAKNCKDYVMDFQTGYVMKDDNIDVDLMGSGNSDLKKKLITLGTLPRSPARESKILTLTRPMAAAKTNCHWSHGDLLLSWVYWQKGMYICFQDNTQLWLDPTAEGVAVVVSGDPLLRVKVLSHISNCIGMLCEEHYLGLAVTVENPCPSCIKCVLRKDNEACVINSIQSPRYSVTSDDLPFSPTLTSPNFINTPGISITDETPQSLFNELQDSSIDFSSICNLFFASISQPASTSTSPRSTPVELVQQSDDDNLSDKVVDNDTQYLCPLLIDPNKEAMPTLDDVRTGHVKMFTNTECIEKAMMDHVIKCESCEQQVMLKSVDPSALLEDYADRLLVDPNLVQCDMESEELGAGSYAKVYKALYDGTPVALKVYNGRNKRNTMLEQAYKDLRSELAIATQLHHPRIAMVTGVCLNPLGIMQQLAPLGSLEEHIAKCPCGMQSGIVHSIIEQISCGLDYLHSLFIIHRDIKPSNVLVWSLSPGDGVDVRLTDYGVSQFKSPSGLRSMKGTEEYMAPELGKFGEHSFYDEKVDIFCLGLMIYELMTGHHLLSQMVYKRDKFRYLFETAPPQLSKALEQSLANCDIFTAVPNKVHPVARLPNQPINTCYSCCFQQLMEACLAQSPDKRPSAKAISVHLGVCPASLPQRSFFIGSTIKKALLGSCDGISEIIIGFSPNKWELFTIIPDKWNFQYHPILHPEDTIGSIAYLNKEVWIATEESCRIYSLSLPDLEGGHLSWSKLAEKPVFMMSYHLHGNIAVLVGLTGGVVAIFDDFGARHLLDGTPMFVDVADNIERNPVVCGCFHKGRVWLGCDRHLVAIDPIKHTVTQACLLSEELLITHVVSSKDAMWAILLGSSELIKCIVTSDGKLHHKSLNLMPRGIPHDKANIVAITVAQDVLWVGTNGGHLFGFHATSCDLLVMRRQHLAIEDIVLLSNHRHMVTFGKSNMLQGVCDENNGSFAVWELFTRPQDHITK